MSNEQHITIRSRCYCGVNDFPASVAISKLPLQQTICHCSACRTVTGTYFNSNIPFPGPRPFDERNPPSTISRYATTDFAARYFCNICSSHMFLHYGGGDNKTGGDVPEEWNACSGCLEFNDTELPKGKTLHKLLHHLWIDDTVDGGLFEQFANPPHLDEAPAYRTSGKKKKVVTEDITKKTRDFKPRPKGVDNDRLVANCRCGSVVIHIRRPVSKLCYPPHTDSPDTDSFDPPYNKGKDAWWIRKSLTDPSKRDRFLACSCVCNSCRRISGNDIQQWLFIPTSCIRLVQRESGEEISWPEDNDLENLELANSKGIEEGLGIKIYNSSPGVTRGFCKTCGANVFWSSPRRTHMIDISAGLVSNLPEDGSTGSRRDEWVDWKTKYLSFPDDAKGRGELVERLTIGLKELFEK